MRRPDPDDLRAVSAGLTQTISASARDKDPRSDMACAMRPCAEDGDREQRFVFPSNSPELVRGGRPVSHGQWHRQRAGFRCRASSSTTRGVVVWKSISRAHVGTVVIVAICSYAAWTCESRASHASGGMVRWEGGPRCSARWRPGRSRPEHIARPTSGTISYCSI